MKGTKITKKQKLTLWDKIKLAGHFIINLFRSNEALEKEAVELRKKLEYYQQLLREQEKEQKDQEK